MRVERWVLPPAIAAAVFTTLAIVPPGGAPARGLRVERIAGPVDREHPLLVRVAIEDAHATAWRPPHDAIFRLGRPGGVWTVRHVVTSTSVPYAFATLIPPEGNGPLSLRIEADGYAVDVPVRSIAREGSEPIDPPRGEHGVELRVEGGALVPEVPATVLARFDGIVDGDVEMTGTDDTIRIAQSHARPDLCGVCAFEVTVTGLDAHVVVRTPGAGDRDVRRALPVEPGGLSLRSVEEGAIEVTTAIGDQPVFVLAGDEHGIATYWSAQRLAPSGDANAALRIALPVASAWALAALSPRFDAASGAWLRTPQSSRCTATPLGERFVRAVTPPPNPPSTRVIHDGARVAGHLRERRQDRIRSIALALAAAAIAMLITLIVAANLGREAPLLREAALTDRRRIWIALGGALSLLVGGAVLLSAFALRQ